MPIHLLLPHSNLYSSHTIQYTYIHPNYSSNNSLLTKSTKSVNYLSIPHTTKNYNGSVPFCADYNRKLSSLLPYRIQFLFLVLQAQAQRSTIFTISTHRRLTSPVRNRRRREQNPLLFHSQQIGSGEVD